MFTAHISEKDGREQDVSRHCGNVALLCAKETSKIGMTHVGWLMGMFHDVGKLSETFNSYIHKENSMSRGEIDHSYAGAKYLVELAAETGEKRLKMTAMLIARGIISHHGLQDWINEDGEDYFCKRCGKNQYYAEIRNNIEKLISSEQTLNLLRWAEKEYGAYKENVRILNGRMKGKHPKRSGLFYDGLLERYLLSCLVDADRTDCFYFESKQDISVYTRHRSNVMIWSVACCAIEDMNRSFAGRSDEISRRRRSISDRCAEFARHQVGICKLIVPTGGGKTLSSLRFALNYCQSHPELETEHIYYIAPFTSIIEQNSDVWKEIVGEEYFLEHHSEVLQKVAGDEEELSRYELKTAMWRTPVIATTLVQFLNSLFSGDMSAVRRMHCLGHSVIVLDEVQAIPTKCIHMFNMAMNFLANICGATIVLCSATQPTLEKRDYPILFDENESMTGEYEADFEAFKRNRIVPMSRPEGYTNEEAARFCMEQLETKQSVLMIVNTKQSALDIYRYLKANMPAEQVELFHLSTSMCPQHRRDCIKRLRERLQTLREIKSNRKVVCVTTQLIEAGVDISFECVVRSEAGLDNAAQAAGRCNRNGEYGYICDTYVLNLNEEKVQYLEGLTSAQKAYARVVESHPEDYAGVAAMSQYYEFYLREEESKLNYSVKNPNTTLLNLLSENKERKELGGIKHPYVQAFKTAGSKFQVIEDSTTGVIVPYDEDARNMIAELSSDISLQRQVEILRRCQKYTITLFQHKMKELIENHLISSVNGEVYILEERGYDMEVGLSMEQTSMDFLCF